MALLTPETERGARDDFERYYAEKIWEWIPEVYRHEDGVAQHPGVLRALVEVMARQAAVARRSIDRLWEDQFIEFCDDWAIAYLGDLVGTRLVHEANRRGRRVDVARTLFYRRRAGTPQVMEALIKDIAGWEGAVVESFRRLARARHGLDPEPEALQGPVTGTPPGGTAELRRPRVGDLVDGPFDETHHTPDVRQRKGLRGRYNIPKLNFHLYRLPAYEVRLATPFDLEDRRFTFDPSGRDVPLFRPSQRPEGDGWRPVREWELPAPIPCRLLGAASYLLEVEDPPEAIEPQLLPLAGQLFVDEARLRRTLLSILTAAEVDAHFAELLAASVTPDSPKIHLLPEAVAAVVAADSGEPPFPHQEVLSGDLEDWGLSLTPGSEKRVVIDPVRGRLLLLQDPGAGEHLFAATYHYGFSGPVGAGTYDRRGFVATDGVTAFDGGAKNGDGDELDPGPIGGFGLPATGLHEFPNSKTYEPDPPPANVLAGVDKLCLQARNPERPYLRLVPEGGADEWTFEALAKPEPAADGGEALPLEDDPDARLLTLEGLWVGIVPSSLSPQLLASAEESCDTVPTTLILDGVFDRVVIRHSTLDPGGEVARIDPLQCLPLPQVALELRGQIEELVIDSSIVGPIREATGTGDPCSVGKITIRDSIVHGLSIVGGVAGGVAIETRVGEVSIERSTVFGDVEVNRLYASEALIQGLVRVIDNQHGCFRFSAADDKPEKRLPPHFESHFLAPRIPDHVFVSRRFGDPGYAQLSDSTPEEILRGAENGSEIGVWSGLLNPIKLGDLHAKVLEFMPFGLIPQFIHET